MSMQMRSYSLPVACLKYGFLLASKILFYILRELVPSEAHARVSMTEEIQSSLKTPTTLTALAEFMEGGLTKLHVGLQLGVHLEPMKCLAVLKHATQKVAHSNRSFDTRVQHRF
eukprot:1878488-Amphidinium_carterae.2